MGTFWVLAALVMSSPGPADGSVVPKRATFELGSLTEFNHVNTLGSTLLPRLDSAYRGLWSAQANYLGGTGNAYSRGYFSVSWNEGDDVWYRSAFFLPTGFKASMQGQVALMRWDNWQSHPTDTDHGGIVIYGSNKRAYLVRERLTQNDQRPLIPAFDLPEGRWFMLEVHQRFGTGADALNEVYLDGQLIGRSTAANFDAGRSIERIRYGIVAIAAGSQTNPLSLSIDESAIDTTGPAVRATSAPEPTEPEPPAVSEPPVTGGKISDPVVAPPTGTDADTTTGPTAPQTGTATPVARPKTRAPKPKRCARYAGKRRRACVRAKRRALVAAKRRAARLAHQRA